MLVHHAEVDEQHQSSLKIGNGISAYRLFSECEWFV
jgi:hypothetical protein